MISCSHDTMRAIFEKAGEDFLPGLKVRVIQ